MKRFLHKIKKIFNIDNIRKRSLDWWKDLTLCEQLKIESLYFDDTSGETTDIDIEAMYRTYINNKN